MPPIVAREAVETSTGKPQSVRLELTVEVVEHDAGLDDAGSIFDIERQDAVQVLGRVDDEAAVDGLAALRRAAAARRDRDAFVARDRERGERLLGRARDDHPERHDLVKRGIGRIAPAVEGVEQDAARDLPPEAGGESVNRGGARRSGCP